MEKNRFTKYSANGRLRLLREEISSSSTDTSGNVQRLSTRAFNVLPRTLSNGSSLLEDDIDMIDATNSSSSINVSLRPSLIQQRLTKRLSLSNSDPLALDITEEAEDEIEYMDWSPSDIQEVVVNLEDIRRNNIPDNHNQFSPNSEFQRAFSNLSTEVQLYSQVISKSHQYIVIDTNIFISDLNLVKQLLKLELKEGRNLVLFIPWMVIQELDFLKDGRADDKLKRSAGWAVKFINKELSTKNPKLRGQSVGDAAKMKFTSSSADDAILYCLLQLSEDGNQPYLLSNDVNLRNKAILNQIEAFGRENILKKLDLLVSNKVECYDENEEEASVHVDMIKTDLSYLFSFIIYKVVEQYSCRMLKNSTPWSLLECINLMKSHWAAVFSRAVNKQCFKLLEEFQQVLKEENCRSATDFKSNLLELGLGLCIYLKNGFPNFISNINECIRKLEQYK